MRRLRLASQIYSLRRRPSRLGSGQLADRDGGDQAEAGGRRRCRGGEPGGEADGVRIRFQEEGFRDGSVGEREEVEGDGE